MRKSGRRNKDCPTHKAGTTVSNYIPSRNAHINDDELDKGYYEIFEKKLMRLLTSSSIWLGTSEG